jgi:hypothetical protein
MQPVGLKFGIQYSKPLPHNIQQKTGIGTEKDLWNDKNGDIGTLELEFIPSRRLDQDVLVLSAKGATPETQNPLSEKKMLIEFLQDLDLFRYLPHEGKATPSSDPYAAFRDDVPTTINFDPEKYSGISVEDP